MTRELSSLDSLTPIGRKRARLFPERRKRPFAFEHSKGEVTDPTDDRHNRADHTEQNQTALEARLGH